MTTSYQDRARIYHEAIRRVLLKEWDPIGVSEIKEAQDGRTPNSIASRFVGASVKNFVGRLEVEAASGTMIDEILDPADFLRGDGSEIHSFGKKLT